MATIKDREYVKFIEALRMVKVDVHNYPRTVFVYDAGGLVTSRTDYAIDKITAVRRIEYTYTDGNVTEVETIDL